MNIVSQMTKKINYQEIDSFFQIKCYIIKETKENCFMFHNEKEDLAKEFKRREEEEKEYRFMRVPSMYSEELNDFIVKCDYKVGKEEIALMAKGLDKDELEAITGYQNVLKVINDNDREPYNKAFGFIIKEEEKHSRWLKMIENGQIAEVLKEQKEE